MSAPFSPMLRVAGPGGFFSALGATLAAASLASAGLAADGRPRMLLLDAALSGTAVVAVGERGTILRSSDHARTWRPAASGARATLTGVSFAPGADAALGWAVGHDALILHTRDGGRTWSRQYQGEDLQDSFLDVLALDSQRAIAVGAYGLCVLTADGGKTWARRKIIPEDAHLNRISRGAAGEICLAGERGTLLRGTDTGDTWRALRAPYDGSFYGLVAVGAPPRAPGGLALVAYGLEGRAFRSDDGGETWRRLENRESVLLATCLEDAAGLTFAGNSPTPFHQAGDALAAAPRAVFRGSVAELIRLADGNLFAVGEAGAEVFTTAWQPLR